MTTADYGEIQQQLMEAHGRSWKVMEAFKISMTQYVANATI